MNSYFAMACSPISSMLMPEVAKKVLEDYRLLLGDDTKSYAACTLTERYARLGLEAEGRALLGRFGEADRKQAENSLEQGRVWRLYDQAMALAQKGDRAGAKAVIAGLPAEIDYTPSIYGIYGLYDFFFIKAYAAPRRIFTRTRKAFNKEGE